MRPLLHTLPWQALQRLLTAAILVPACDDRDRDRDDERRRRRRRRKKRPRPER